MISTCTHKSIFIILLLVQTNFNLNLDINNQPSSSSLTSKSNLSHQRSTISSNNQRPSEFYYNQFETCGHLNKGLIIGIISCVRIIHVWFVWFEIYRDKRGSAVLPQVINLIATWEKPFSQNYGLPFTKLPFFSYQ